MKNQTGESLPVLVAEPPSSFGAECALTPGWIVWLPNANSLHTWVCVCVCLLAIIKKSCDIKQIEKGHVEWLPDIPHFEKWPSILLFSTGSDSTCFEPRRWYSHFSSIKLCSSIHPPWPELPIQNQKHAMTLLSGSMNCIQCICCCQIVVRKHRGISWTCPNHTVCNYKIIQGCF